MNKKNKIHFLAGSVPSANIEGYVAVLNWAASKNFEVVNVSDILIPSKRRIVGQQGPSIESTSFFYCSASEKDFETYFGEPYTEEKILEYVKKIGEIENAKMGSEIVV